jgi:TRAP-type C4-dicarboxylate transport system permease small subunit
MKSLINAMEIFNKIFTKIAEAIVIICIAGQAVLIFNTVIFRYFLNNPLTWGDEISVLLLVVITFFGCYLAMRHNKLARIELFIGRFTGKKRTLIYIISELMTLTMLLFVLYFGVILFLSPTSLKQKTPGLYIPLCIFYGMIPITFFASIINTFSKIMNYLKESKV